LIVVAQRKCTIIVITANLWKWNPFANAAMYIAVQDFHTKGEENAGGKIK